MTLQGKTLCSIANQYIREHNLQPGVIVCVVLEAERRASRRSDGLDVVTRRGWYQVRPNRRAVAYHDDLLDYDRVVFVDRRSRHDLERLSGNEAQKEWEAMNPVDPNKRYALSPIALLQRCSICKGGKLEVRLRKGTPFVFCPSEQALRRVHRP